MILSQNLPNKNDLAIQNKENNKHREAKFDSYHERLAVKILPKTTHNQCNLFKKTKKKYRPPAL